MSVWKDWLFTPLNYCRPNHRAGSEALITGWKNMNVFLRKEWSRSHTTKTSLSYQWASLNFCHSAGGAPLPFIRSTILWKHENLPFAHKATELRSKSPGPRKQVRGHVTCHSEHNDAPPDSPPERPLRTYKQLFTVLLLFVNWGLQKYYMLWFPDFDFRERKYSLRNFGGK